MAIKEVTAAAWRQHVRAHRREYEKPARQVRPSHCHHTIICAIRNHRFANVIFLQALRNIMPLLWGFSRARWESFRTSQTTNVGKECVQGWPRALLSQSVARSTGTGPSDRTVIFS